MVSATDEGYRCLPAQYLRGPAKLLHFFVGPFWNKSVRGALPYPTTSNAPSNINQPETMGFCCIWPRAKPESVVKQFAGQHNECNAPCSYACFCQKRLCWVLPEQ